MTIKWLGRSALAAVILATLAAGGCGRKETAPGRAEPAVQYPEPRYPSYLRPVSTIEEILPHVRPLVRNKTGFQGAGLGIAKSGDTVTFVTGPDADDLIVQAVKRAMEERGVKVNVVPEYEMVGVSKEDALEFRRIRRSYTAEQGYMEAATWVESNFPNPGAIKDWLKGRRPDLYDKLFPKTRDLSPRLVEVQQKFMLPSMGKGIQAYLTSHPEVRGIFWGKGGGTFLRRNLHPMEDKFLGLFVVDNRWDVMSALGTYPGDVWQLAEDQLMEPLIHVDKLTAKDPEGTDVWADINEEQASHWARGVYQRGHLYMFPNQATGRFGYSVVDYPAFQKEWLPREPLAIIHGTIAGTTNHTGFFPRWEVVFNDNGYISEVKGGGTTGDALREFMQIPGINDLVYPFHKPEHKGYWYLYEIAFGTHPKAFRNPQGLDDGTVIPERLRAGVIHWGLGITLHHDPDVQTQSQKLLDFTTKNNMPRDHGFHTAHLLHDLQGPPARRRSLGDAARQGPDDEPRQPGGAGVGLPLRQSGRAARRGLAAGDPRHQRAGRLYERLRSRPVEDREGGDRQGPRRHLRALLSGPSGARGGGAGWEMKGGPDCGVRLSAPSPS